MYKKEHDIVKVRIEIVIFWILLKSVLVLNDGW